MRWLTQLESGIEEPGENVTKELESKKPNAVKEYNNWYEKYSTRNLQQIS